MSLQTRTKSQTMKLFNSNSMLLLDAGTLERWVTATGLWRRREASKLPLPKSNVATVRLCACTYLIVFLVRSSNALFQMEWQEDGSIGFRANNGKFIGTKKSGHLFANADLIDDSSKFFFYLINRYTYNYLRH